MHADNDRPEDKPTAPHAQLGLETLALAQARCAELSRELGETRRDLSSAQRELEEVLYIFSHDFRAPLRGINSIVSWIEEDYAGLLDEAGREHMADLRQCAHRLTHMIEAVLTYSRAGRQTPVLETVDSAKAAREVWRRLSPPARIRLRLEEPLPQPVIDRAQFEQLLECLFDNAVKHLGKPQGEAVIAGEDLPDSWRFCVRDDGKGVESRHFDRIFQLFGSLDADDESEATGMGLALARKIARRYGGDLWVASTVGSGCSFFFTISKSPPVFADPGEAPPAPIQRRPPPARSEHS